VAPPAPAGTVRQVVQLDAAQGPAVLLDAAGDVVAAATGGGYLRTYQLAGWELKQLTGPGVCVCGVWGVGCGVSCGVWWWAAAAGP
jgi:hypothetical protein